MLAEYDGGVVTTEEFLNNYHHYLSATGIQDNMSSRKRILDNVINEELVLAEFDNSEMAESVDYIETRNLIYEQLLLNFFYDCKVIPETDFSNRQLTKFYARENTRFHIRQIFADTYDEAKEYHRLLTTGTTFEELVRRKKLSDTNCDLGFVSLNDLHPRFRSAIQNLAVGTISEPLKGEYGYTVLKVEEKRVKPLLTEYEFAQQKRQLIRKIAAVYRDSIQHDYISKQKTELDIAWVDSNLPHLLEVFKNISGKNDLPVHSDTRGIFSKKVCSLGPTSYNYYSLLPLILKSRIEQLTAVTDIEGLKDFISGILIRERLIERAKSLGIDKNPDFIRQYNQKVTKLKIDYWVQNFTDSVQFSETDYQYYYQANQTEFILPVRRKIFEICTKDRRTACHCISRFEAGENFHQMAAEFVQNHQRESDDGFLGILTSAELGRFGTAVFSAPLGEIVGPYQYDDAYYLFLSTAGYASQPLSLQQAKPIIARQYRHDLSRRRMVKHFEQKAEEYHIHRYYQVLKTIKYQDVGHKGGSLVNG